MIEGEPGRTKLTALKAAISSSLVTDTFTTPENLAYKTATSVGRYLAQPSYLLLPPPEMQIVSPGSCFGRLDSKDGCFALLLKMKFYNKSTQPVLLQRFRIQYTDSWYEPRLRTGNVYLHISTKVFAEALRKEDDITESLLVLEMDERKRHASSFCQIRRSPFLAPKDCTLPQKRRSCSEVRNRSVSHLPIEAKLSKKGRQVTKRTHRRTNSDLQECGGFLRQ